MMSHDVHQQDYYEAVCDLLIERRADFLALEIIGLIWTEIDTHDDFAVANKKIAASI